MKSIKWEVLMKTELFHQIIGFIRDDMGFLEETKICALPYKYLSPDFGRYSNPLHFLTSPHKLSLIHI